MYVYSNVRPTWGTVNVPSAVTLGKAYDRAGTEREPGLGR